MPTPELLTPRLRLRPTIEADLEPLTAILAEPAVARFWSGYDRARVRDELILSGGDKAVLAIERLENGEVLGAVQFHSHDDAEYPHAGVDLFLASRAHGQGFGTETLRAVVHHLFARGHHRLVIDPAVDNKAAIRAYERVGFRTVGVMRAYQRTPNGFQDGLLMELLATDFRLPASGSRATDTMIRTAIVEDVPFLVAQMIDFNRGERIDWDPVSGEVALRRLIGDARLGRVAIVLIDGAPAGYAVVTYGYDLEYGGPDALLTEFHLGATARGRGAGSRAIMLLLDDLREAGYGAVHLQVRPENIPAQRVYRAAGFVQTTRMFFTRLLGGGALP
jgi:aminoglycoside 6'-N-acetyltransferase